MVNSDDGPDGRWSPMVDQQSMTLKCIRCNKNFRMLDMVMDSSGRGMSCRPCAGLAPRKVDTPFERQRIVPSPVKKSGSLPPGTRQRLACNDCKYRFASAKPVETLSCPYCGSKRLATQSEMSADSLISASVERRFE